MIDGQVHDNGQNVGSCCFAWWKKYINADTGQARVARARLRRARTPIDALAIEAVHDLNINLAQIGESLKRDPNRLALITIVLAHVKENVKEPTAEKFGSKQGEQAILSGIRFSTLIKCKKPVELINLLPRALKIVDGQANVRKLANDLFYWGEKTRTDWCFQYYGHSHAAPFEISQT